jgi:hypothetical protein
MATINGTFNSLIAGTISGTVGTPGPQGPAGAQGLPGAPGAPGVGVPAGGLEGQVLLKASDVSYDTAWFDNYAATVQATVRNETGATLTKGTVVYISGGAGNKPLVSKASASTEASSSKTFAILAADIPTNSNGQAVTLGLLKGLNTSAFTAGANLWLSTVPGQIVSPNPPASPAHSVFLGNVVRVHATQGEIEVRIQNGQELGELHDVLLTSPTEGQVLKYDATTGLWKNGTDVGGVAWGGITGTLSAQTDLQSALDGKYSTTNPSGFITSSALTGYATESFVTSQGYITASALTGYATESWVTSQGYITSSALTPYLTTADAATIYFTIASAAGKANLSGATFTGKVNLPDLGVNTPSLNLGGTALSTTATSAASGDVWISGATSPKLTYKVGGANLYCATSNLTNTFTSSQIIDVTTATSAALRVTQKGTANAIEVEDSTTPDSTRFVVDQFGKVGIGVAPDSSAALKVDTNGIMFGDGTTQTTAAVSGFIPGSGNLELGSNYVQSGTSSSGSKLDGNSVSATAGLQDVPGTLFRQSVMTSDGQGTGESSYGTDGFGNPYVILSKQNGFGADSFTGTYNDYDTAVYKSFSLSALNGLNFGSGTISVTSTGITFPDSTVQTTAAVAGITDAPSDGNYYVRKDGAWVQCTVVSIYDSNSSASYNCLTV